MNGIFDGGITETFSAQDVDICGLDLIRRQGQLFNQVQCGPQFLIDRGTVPVI